MCFVLQEAVTTLATTTISGNHHDDVDHNEKSATGFHCPICPSFFGLAVTRIVAGFVSLDVHRSASL